MKGYTGMHGNNDKKEKQEAITMCQDIVENYKESDVNMTHNHKK